MALFVVLHARGPPHGRLPPHPRHSNSSSTAPAQPNTTGSPRGGAQRGKAGNPAGRHPSVSKGAQVTQTRMKKTTTEEERHRGAFRQPAPRTTAHARSITLDQRRSPACQRSPQHYIHQLLLFGRAAAAAQPGQQPRAQPPQAGGRRKDPPAPQAALADGHQRALWPPSPEQPPRTWTRHPRPPGRQRRKDCGLPFAPARARRKNREDPRHAAARVGEPRGRRCSRHPPEIAPPLPHRRRQKRAPRAAPLTREVWCPPAPRCSWRRRVLRRLLRRRRWCEGRGLSSSECRRWWLLPRHKTKTTRGAVISVVRDVPPATCRRRPSSTGP